MRQQLLAQTETLAELLTAKGMMIALAESCTGGMLSELMTALPGSSAWFDRGFITYSNEAKIEVLGVRETTLITHGAVSAACVEEMALGALQASHAQLSVAISGIAGPAGGSVSKPVGTVWFGYAGHHIIAKTQLHQFTGDREQIRQQATAAALAGMIECLMRPVDEIKPIVF